MADLHELLDLLDLATVRAAVVEDAELDRRLDELGRRLRVRRGFVGDALAVAVAGGTGSGKSSLVNAIVGSHVVRAGVVRPTTQSATGVVPGGLTGTVGDLLSAIGVDERVEVEAGGPTVLIDMPDYDSIEEAHRHIVEDVLPRVDAVLWVTDPEKYADPITYEAFLGPLREYQSQFLFALNKADRVPGESSRLVEDMEGKLAAVGYDRPHVLATAAVGPGDSLGDVSELTELLRSKLDVRNTALRKLALDVRDVARIGWQLCSERRSDAGDDREESAFAAATFVSLGVAGYGLYARAAVPRTEV